MAPAAFVCLLPFELRTRAEDCDTHRITAGAPGLEEGAPERRAAAVSKGSHAKARGGEHRPH